MLLCLQVNLNRGAGGRSLTQGELFLVLPRAELPQSEGGNKDAKKGGLYLAATCEPLQGQH